MLVTILIAGGALVTTGLVAVIADYMRENRELRDIIANFKYRESVNRATALEIWHDLKVCKIERQTNENLLARKVKRVGTGIWL